MAIRQQIPALLASSTLVICACAGSETRTSRDPQREVQTTPEASAPTDPLALSRRVYELGEAAWSGGAKFEAVALWRQAFRSIPPDEQHDVLRHRMVMRIGHGLLELHRLDGDSYHLEAGKQMVERWIAVRAERDTSGARDEAYELLGEFELRLESPPARSDADEEFERGELERSRMLASYDGAQADFAAQQSHAGEVLDADGVSRKIEVSQLASLDDPKVQAFLRHPSPEGPSLFDRPGDPFNPTRPLVRAGIPRIGDAREESWRDANKATWEIIREQREALELCYASSMARAPTEVVRMQVTLRVDEDGSVEAERTDGDKLGDSIGDACVRRAFERSRVVDPMLHGRVLAVVPLTFFIQPGVGPMPSAWGLGGFDAAIGDREGSYTADRQTETGMGVSRGQPSQ